MSDIVKKITTDPYSQFLGINVEKIENNYALCSVTITAQMLNFLGLVHGGLIFSLADAAFAAASNYDYCPSYALDISGSFLKTAQIGDKIRAEARLIHSTKRTGIYRMDIFKNEDLLATFNGTVFKKV